jgi:hypothetical protein
VPDLSYNLKYVFFFPSNIIFVNSDNTATKGLPHRGSNSGPSDMRAYKCNSRTL